MEETIPQVSAGSFEGWIGVARRDITPPIGIYARSWGAAAHDTAEGIHRPLTATALTIQRERGGPPLALLSLDLGWWRRAEEEWSLRSAVLAALGAETAQVLIHFTHTHAGPSLCRAESGKPGGHLIGPYLDGLQAACVSAVKEAINSAQQAILDWAYGHCSLARNRDLPDPAAPRWLCGFNPSLAADTTLLVGRAATRTGAPLATLVNYACHPTTLAWENRLISPDFVGAMREVIESKTGDAPCLFLQGASGELGPGQGYTGDVGIADQNGRQLGYAALGIREGMPPPGTHLEYAGVVESGAPLATWKLAAANVSSDLRAERVEVSLALKAMPSIAEIERELKQCSDRALAERLERKKWVRESVGDSSATSAPAWIWRIGDALVVAHPNEAYSMLQTALRHRHPERPVVVLNVTNGHAGYLPPAEFFDRDLYPVWQTPFAAGGLEKLIERCGEACDRLMAS